MSAGFLARRVRLPSSLRWATTMVQNTLSTGNAQRTDKHLSAAEAAEGDAYACFRLIPITEKLFLSHVRVQDPKMMSLQDEEDLASRL